MESKDEGHVKKEMSEAESEGPYIKDVGKGDEKGNGGVRLRRLTGESGPGDLHV